MQSLRFCLCTPSQEPCQSSDTFKEEWYSTLCTQFENKLQLILIPKSERHGNSASITKLQAIRMQERYPPFGGKRKEKKETVQIRKLKTGKAASILPSCHRDRASPQLDHHDHSRVATTSPSACWPAAAGLYRHQPGFPQQDKQKSCLLGDEKPGLDEQRWPVIFLSLCLSFAWQISVVVFHFFLGDLLALAFG